MKLPNFDEFEPLIAIRNKMDAKSESPLSLVTINRLNAITVDNAPLDWSTPEAPEAAVPLKQIITPPRAPIDATVTHTKMPQALIADPKKTAAKPATQNGARATHKTAAPQQKMALVFSRILAVVAYTAVGIALLVVVMSYKKKEYLPAAKYTPPRVQPQKPPTPPPTKKLDTPVAAPAPPPAAAPSAELPASPAAPVILDNSTSADFSPHNDTPSNNSNEVTVPDISDTQGSAQKITAPTAEEEQEMIGLRIGETRPNAPPPEQRKKDPSEFDLNDRPFSDALRNAGKPWYTKVEKRPKPKEDRQ